MKKCLFSSILLLILASGAYAEDTPVQTATVGGGLQNPWRPPYKTAVVLVHSETAFNNH